MKIIDIHTHFFPDSIAEGTVTELGRKAGITPCGDGSLCALRQVMKEDGVDISVNQPVATKPEQVIPINRKMIAHNSDPKNRGVICFGSMHPNFNRVGNVVEELEFLAEKGVKGIKLHSEYQDFVPDDGRLKRIYETCAKLGLIILFHAGEDLAFDEPKATPKRLLQVTKVRGLKLIFAHLGGYRLWEDSFRFLAGTGAYLDTAYTAEISQEQLSAIVKKHGADKVLFGSDMPWQRPSAIAGKIKAAITSEAEREMIFYSNAAALLGIRGDSVV